MSPYSTLGGIHVQKGEVSNSLPFSLLLLLTQTFMGHLLDESTVFGPQDANIKTASVTTGDTYKARATWQELLGTYYIQAY